MPVTYNIGKPSQCATSRHSLHVMDVLGRKGNMS